MGCGGVGLGWLGWGGVGWDWARRGLFCDGWGCVRQRGLGRTGEFGRGGDE